MFPNPNRELCHNCRDIEQIFARCFTSTFNTRLLGGAPEPLYLPAGFRADELWSAEMIQREYACNYSSHHLIFYREDFFSSALHEVAHWCIAGEKRRQEMDFGYWYEPDGRSAEMQASFFAVEVKPQALELLFCLASGRRFEVSVDNVSSVDITDGAGNKSTGIDFAEKVFAQARDYLHEDIPERAAQFIRALGQSYEMSVDRPALFKALDEWGVKHLSRLFAEFRA